ncbi:MAG: divergent PAP2 family protein [Comamonadaceae bacterium]|nr:divergent PAP2 family protein [Comamonadaceae bacterium]
MTDWAYLVTPFLSWLVAGALKFLVNSVKARQLAFGLIGYGGLPSNHSAIVSSMAALVALKEGCNTPAFGVALTVAFIVVLDANGLRCQVGRQANMINLLAKTQVPYQPLRERVGHTKVEIIAGLLVGIAVATGVWWLQR